MAGSPLFIRLILSATASLGLTISEFYMSYYTHSLSLLVVANQSFYNLLSLATGASSIAMVNSNAASITQKTTFGWHRIEVVGALSSLVFLGSLSFGTAIEAMQTMFHSGHLDLMHEPIHIFILAFAHVLIWLMVLTLIGGYSFYQNRCVNAGNSGPNTVNEDFRPPYLDEIKLADIFRDLASCVILMIVSALVYLLDENLYPNAIKFVDPVLALTSIIIIISTSVNLFKELSLILLQGIPKSLGTDIDEIKECILEKCPTTVVHVHEFHVWCLEPNQIICSLHVIYNDFKAYEESHNDVLELLKNKGITEITIQPEFPKLNEEDLGDGLKNLIQTSSPTCQQSN